MSQRPRGAALLVGALGLTMGATLIPANAQAATTSTGVVFNNLSLSTAMNADTSSDQQADDIVVKNGDRLYLGSSSDPSKLSGWMTMSDGSKKAFTPADYTLTSTGDHAYSMTFKNGSSLKINIVKSANVPSMYLRTHDGKSLANVEAVKGNTDVGGTMALVNPDGTTTYNGTLSELKGHGNSTWGYPKKPYQIKLDKSTELVPGAGASKTWLLVANYLDGSYLRNEVANNLESAVLQRAGQTDDAIKGRMIDLYIDGNYRGSYYLCEKVQVNDTRVNITDTDKLNNKANPTLDLDTVATKKASSSDSRFSNLKEAQYVTAPNNAPDYQNAGYLLQMEFDSRVRGERSYFITKHGTPMILQTPENATADETSFIGNRIADFEDALYSVTGKNASGQTWQSYVDVDSLARYYALQEFLDNEDGFKTSTYFHIDKGGKLQAGPVWDCDRCVGAHTYAPPADRIHVGSWSRQAPLWVRQLLLTPHFRAAVQKQYTNYVYPEAQTILSSKLTGYANEVYYSALADKLRWGKNVSAHTVVKATPQEDVALLRSYMTTRTSALENTFGSANYLKNAPLADGIYRIMNGKLVADVKGASTASGANVQLDSTGSGDSDKFKITRGEGGLYTIVNVKSGKALDVVKGAVANGTNVDQATPNGSLAQKWLIGTTDGSTYTIASALTVSYNTTAMVLTATGNKTTSGTNLEIRTDSAATGQRFGFTAASASTSTGSGSTGSGSTTGSTGSGSTTGSTTTNIGSLVTKPVAGKTYTIVSALNKNMVMDVAGGSSANKTNIDLYTANGSKAQQFTLTAGPNGTYILKTGPGGVVDVANSGKTAGTNVDQYAANGTTAQQWILKSTGDGDGSFYIVSKLSGLNLDVKSSGTTNGTNIQTYTANKTAAQKFYFYAK